MAVFRIGCLAWGSLVWDPRSLPTRGAFRDDGPRLPIEFSRVALDGRVTLVIDSKAREVQTRWTLLAVNGLEEAVEQLGLRERIPATMWPRWIGRQGRRDLESRQAAVNGKRHETIAGWLEEQALDAVVWTALPIRGPDGEPERPDVECLLRHLGSLEGEARVRAEEYIRRAPGSTRTAYRARFEEFLGWFPADGGD